MKPENSNYGINWANINLSSPYERSLNLLDPYNFETLLLEINHNCREITSEAITAQFMESLNIKIETAKSIFKSNVSNILKAAIEERNSDELESAKPLKQRILKAFPGAEFDRHETDLYVKVIPGLKSWLKSNHDHYTNIQPFTSSTDGEQWLDIPFAAWDEKYKS